MFLDGEGPSTKPLIRELGLASAFGMFGPVGLACSDDGKSAVSSTAELCCTGLGPI